MQHSIGLVTALNPVFGYEKSAANAKEALVTNPSVYQLVLEKNLLTQAQLDDILEPENMTNPRKSTSRA
jgi:aspartate ammonia-lyase